MSTQKMSRLQLTAMVVGGMVGAGIFSLPRTFAGATGPLGAVIAWLIAGTGMYMLARVFQALAERRPDIDAGVYAYAREGFGDYAGFLSAFGYWIGSCIGNVSYWVLIKSTLGAFFPIFGDGNTAVAIVVASLGIWSFHFLILRGVQQAAFINSIVTVAKVIPILVFIVIGFFAFKIDLFSFNFYGGDLTNGLFEQVKATMLVTVFVFIGIEGRQRLFALRQGAQGRRQGHDHRLRHRHQPDGAGHAAAVRAAAARRHRRHAPAVDGRRCSSPWSGPGARSSSA
jgi:arginine:ornithine antiporter / lysine permease